MKKKKMKLDIAVAPCFVNSIKKGIVQKLNSFLVRYSEKMEGVLIAYSKLKLAQPYGTIVNENPYVHCCFTMEGLVFSPKEGKWIEGVVHEVRENHVGLLVLGQFSASIYHDCMLPGYKYSVEEKEYKHEEGDASITVGCTILFRIQRYMRCICILKNELFRVHTASGMVSIDGSMLNDVVSKKRKKSSDSASKKHKKKKI